jgi:hypothetical protein
MVSDPSSFDGYLDAIIRLYGAQANAIVMAWLRAYGRVLITWKGEE